MPTQATQPVSDIHVVSTQPLPSPLALATEIPRSEAHQNFVAQTRETLHQIIFGDDPRLLIVAGPCSIHDIDSGLEYAERFRALAAELSDRLFLVMRAYFEKPRTAIGWKGLIMDPQLDGSCDIPKGLRTARTFLRDLVDMGIPTATELLDPITPQYIADLICWSCIGARTTESQTHRQMASGLSMPLGFKNSTDGSIEAAINAIRAASKPQTFLGINPQGIASAVTTRGNPGCHLVLRGGRVGPNFSHNDIAEASALLKSNHITPAIMVDCSHGNSNKDYRLQPEVLAAIADQSSGNPAIIGAMLESNLGDGSQSFPQPKEKLRKGISITDGCIGWERTESALRDCHARIRSRFTNRGPSA